MDFTSSLPRIKKGNGYIWVIVDHLAKSVNFLLMKIGKGPIIEKLTKLYITEIIKLHGVPVSIMSDKNSKFVFGSLITLHEALGTSLNFNTLYHS